MSIARDLAASFLRDHADRLGAMVCNDFSIPDNPENRAFMEAAHRWNSKDPDEAFDPDWSCRDGVIHTTDFFICGYVAHLIEKGEA